MAPHLMSSGVVCVWKQAIVLLVVVLVAVSFLPVHQAESAPFATPTFESRWLESRGDLLDPWGDTPLAWRIEPYADASGGQRLVQYFDRGRMELDTRSSQDHPSVTEGLLAWELVTGRVALGDELFTPLPPPVIPLDGGDPDPRVPTYASFAQVVQQPASDCSTLHPLLTTWIDAHGTLHDGPPPALVHCAQFIADTQHNLPDVTLAFFAQSPFGQRTWVDVLGLPLSEPYWGYYRQNAIAYPALFQIFQRRVLVYIPELPEGKQFVLPSIGRHYYRWRYGQEATQPWPNPKPGAPASDLTVSADATVGVFAQGLDRPIGVAIAPDGLPLILTADGTILKAVGENSDGTAAGFTTFTRGLRNPRGLAVSQGWVYVTDDNGVSRFRDLNGDGIADQSQQLSTTVVPVPGTDGAPVVDSTDRIFFLGIARSATGAAGQPQLFQVGLTGAMPVSPLLTLTGPVFTWGSLVFAFDQAHDAQHPRIVQIGSEGATTATSAAFALPSGNVTTAALLYTARFWPAAPPGTLFTVAQGQVAGVLYQLLPGTGSTPPRTTTLISGLAQPSALAVGLDGTLYIVESAAGRVLKVIPAPSNRQAIQVGRLFAPGPIPGLGGTLPTPRGR